MSRGVGFILGGLSIAFGGYRIWKTGWNFRDTLPVPRFAGIPVAIFGIMMIFLGIRIIMNRGKQPDQYMICPVCETVVKFIQGTDEKCPQCGAKIDVLEGFYERHPGFKATQKRTTDR
jgi:hypothetical protein